MNEKTLPEPVAMMDAPIYLPYHFVAGRSASRFLRRIKDGRIVGQRCRGHEQVYVPSRGACPMRGEPTDEDVELSGNGTLESFTIVHIPIPQNPLKPPFVVGGILLDGASASFIHLVSEVDNADVRIGMRLQPVWKPEAEWTYSMENIRYFKPLDEPDVDVDAMLRERREALLETLSRA